ncbi:MAG: hypothetical protein B6I30_07780, partial [Desulfobacteraceae bacterium 4572_187]
GRFHAYGLLNLESILLPPQSSCMFSRASATKIINEKKKCEDTKPYKYSQPVSKIHALDHR